MVFILNKIQILEVKFSIYLNRRVFVTGVIGRPCSVTEDLLKHVVRKYSIQIYLYLG